MTQKHTARWATLLLSPVIVSAGAGTASATFHQWKIDEVYSSGSIQFFEFSQGSFVFDDERFLAGHPISETALGHTFNFPANLPAAPVANQHFLLASPGYAALAGVPTADYVLPINDFFSTAGDTLNFALGTDVLTFTGAQLPSNGTDSLNRTSYGSSTYSSLANSPSNFAGQTGSVSPWRTADVNGDGQVSVGDLGILATHFNQTLAGGRTVGDLNLDGGVTVGDLGILATYFGQPSAGAAQSFPDALKAFPALASGVPEPLSATWVAAALLPALARRRRGLCG